MSKLFFPNDCAVLHYAKNQGVVSPRIMPGNLTTRGPIHLIIFETSDIVINFTKFTKSVGVPPG